MNDIQVVDGHYKYKPRVHVGTEEEIVNGLIDEMDNIVKDGWMRLHAKDRECTRIIQELRDKHGVSTIGESEEGSEWFSFVKEHKPDCDPEGICSCPSFREIEAY